MTKDIVGIEQLYFDFSGLAGIDYALSFAHEANIKAKIELKDGDHSIIGLDSGTGSTNHLKFGSGATDVWLTGSADWERVKIEGKDGNHRILVEQVVSEGVEVKLNDGASAVVLGTKTDDQTTKIEGGDGDFSVRSAGLGTVKLGNGSHIVDVGLVSNLELGDGNSQISFQSGLARQDQSVLAGNGNHLVLGQAVSNDAQTTITLGNNTGFNAGSVVQLTDAYQRAEINAGSGDHVVHVEQAAQVTVRVGGRIDGDGKPLDGFGSQTIVLDQISNIATVQMGHGNHKVHVGNDKDDRASLVAAGDGDSQIKIDGGRYVILGDGNHVVDAGEVDEINIGSGTSQISFSTGRTDTQEKIFAGDGDHTIIGVTTGSLANAWIQFGAGDSTIQLTGNDALSGTKIRGEEGDHSILIEKVSGVSIELKDGNQTVKLADIEDGKTELKLGDGDHRIELWTDARDELATIAAGHGNTSIFVDGGRKLQLKDGNHVINAGDVQEISVGDGNSYVETGDGDKLSLGSGNHVVRAGEVLEIKTGSGHQQIYFEDGKDSHEVDVTTYGIGDDIIVGQRTTSKAAARIESHDGNDIIVLLGGEWEKSEINGGSGYDILFIDEESFMDGTFKAKEFEEVVFIPTTATIEYLTDILGDGGFAFGSSTASEIFPKGSIGIAPIEAEAVDISIGIVDTIRSFDLVPTPDPDGLGAAVELIYDDAPASNLGDGSREDRLMESATTFFLRIESYELTYQATSSGSFGSEPGYNEFGDFAGTNGSDQMFDTLGSSYIFAMAGDDLIDADDGDDAIYGGGGDDVIRGGEGQDLLDGGKGYDILIGGAGIDIFVFRKGDGTTEIEDFELSHDILDVEGFESLTYDVLTAAGRQIGDDVFYDLGDDVLILRNVDLGTMVEVDLCIK